MKKIHAAKTDLNDKRKIIIPKEDDFLKMQRDDVSYYFKEGSDVGVSVCGKFINLKTMKNIQPKKRITHDDYYSFKVLTRSAAKIYAETFLYNEKNSDKMRATYKDIDNDEDFNPDKVEWELYSSNRDVRRKNKKNIVVDIKNNDKEILGIKTMGNAARYITNYAADDNRHMNHRLRYLERRYRELGYTYPQWMESTEKGLSFRFKEGK